MATNRADTLDPALLRPGRLDRKIEFPMPDRRQKRLIFSTVTAKMNLSDEVDLEDYVARPDKISGADITAICQEAGMLAVRKNRYVILAKDFESGKRIAHGRVGRLCSCAAGLNLGPFPSIFATLFVVLLYLIYRFSLTILPFLAITAYKQVVSKEGDEHSFYQ